MPNVLVTHSDEPLGRRVVKLLWHDEEIGRIFALGSEAAPRAFDTFRAGASPRFAYARIDLAKHRPMSDFFHSAPFRECEIDTVVHVPQHGVASEGPPLAGRVSTRAAEARLVLQHALATRSVRSLVAVGSAFVYRLDPGNANHLTESSELDLDPDTAPGLRPWIDCDMLFHGEVGNPRLRVALLRMPTVVASGGYVYLHPGLAGRAGPRLRPLGFDPLCAVISDKDAARAVQAAVHSGAAGTFNLAGREAIPLSTLGRWTRRPCLPVPGPLLRAARAGVGRFLGDPLRGALDGPHLRYGFTLDTRRAERVLGFRPEYRIGLARAGDGGLRLETARAHSAWL
jgi:nucleoside-diphosphate-sugar epimerase